MKDLNSDGIDLLDSCSNVDCSGSRVGLVEAIDNGKVYVTFGKVTVRVSAKSIVSVDIQDIGSEVLLAFLENDPRQPVILGKLNSDCAKDADATPQVFVDDTPTPLEITGEKEITLRCGKASITLTKAGKIILRGTYISSRSSGMNRIKGGSVQLN